MRAAKNWLKDRLRPQSTRLVPRALSALPTGIARGALQWRCSGGELQGEELQGGDAAGLRPAQRSQPSLGLREDRLRALARVGGSKESRKRRDWGDRVPTQAFLCTGRSVCTSASRTCTRTFHASLAGGSDSREACDRDERSPPESEERR